MFRTASIITLLTILVCSTPAAEAAGRGDGACLANRAEVFETSTGQRVIATLEAGDCVAGVTVRGGGLFGQEFIFEEEDGRAHIAFVTDRDKGFHRLGYIKPSVLSRFTYECGCGSLKEQREQCTPFSEAGLFPIVQVYNSCFKEGMERKKSELRSQVTSPPPPAGKDSAGGRAEKALSNADVLTLVKVGLGEQLIVAKILEAPAVDFDLSTDGIVALKTANTSNPVIEAMMKRAASRK